jgi:Uncharacterized protein conserved in bacteria (DUF2330)
MRWAVLLALAAVARADGKFVSTKVPVVEIPDQQAILVWRDGRERLVIDTAHAGEGDLAWIVPLPSPPTIEPVSPAVFRTLEAVTMPETRHEPSNAWQVGLCLLLAGALLSISRSVVAALAATLLLLFGALLFMSALIPRSHEPTVTVLGRSRAGSYETATVEAADAGALLAWLDRDGFKVAEGTREAIEKYVRDGWVFAVARLKSGGPGGRAHPLSFEFDAKEPVYPMRLTGTQDRPVSLRLFVLSDRRASCDALTTESCYRTRAAAPPYGDDEVRQIGQPELLRIVAGATVLTTLAGGLVASRDDLRIRFEEYASRAPVVYSEDAARAGAAGITVWVALAVLAAWHGIAIVRFAAPMVSRRWKIVALCVAIDVGLVAGVVDYMTADIAELRSTFLGNWIHHARARSSVEASTDIAAARTAAAAVWRGQTNMYDGLAVREEPSPDNYGIELRQGRIVYVQYDRFGTPMDRDDW